jgi:hypothetical protein
LCFRFPLLATTTPPIIGYSRQELNRAAALHLQARTTAQELSAVPYQFDTMVKTQKGVGWEAFFPFFIFISFLFFKWIEKTFCSCFKEDKERVRVYVS